MTVTRHYARLGNQLLAISYILPLPSQTAEFDALARRNSHTNWHTGSDQAVNDVFCRHELVPILIGASALVLVTWHRKIRQMMGISDWDFKRYPQSTFLTI